MSTTSATLLSGGFVHPPALDLAVCRATTTCDKYNGGFQGLEHFVRNSVAHHRKPTKPRERQLPTNHICTRDANFSLISAAGLQALTCRTAEIHKIQGDARGMSWSVFSAAADEQQERNEYTRTRTIYIFATHKHTRRQLVNIPALLLFRFSFR